MSRGRPAVTYVDNLKTDSCLESVEELKTAMLDCVTCRRRAESRRALSRP